MASMSNYRYPIWICSNWIPVNWAPTWSRANYTTYRHAHITNQNYVKVTITPWIVRQAVLLSMILNNRNYYKIREEDRDKNIAKCNYSKTGRTDYKTRNPQLVKKIYHSTRALLMTRTIVLLQGLPLQTVLLMLKSRLLIINQIREFRNSYD